jgi:O-antigen/teichoic acid export membrane protein
MITIQRENNVFKVSILTERKIIMSMITHNPLSYHHSMWSLLKFAAPSIGMMIVISLYTVTDGIFIGRYVGSDALAASNIVYPAFNLVLGLAIMLAAGGSALVAKTLGEGNSELAGRRFTLITASAAVLSLLLAFFLWLFMEPLLYFLGASPALYEDCAKYISALLPFFPAAALMMATGLTPGWKANHLSSNSINAVRNLSGILSEGGNLHCPSPAILAPSSSPLRSSTTVEYLVPLNKSRGRHRR